MGRVLGGRWPGGFQGRQPLAEPILDLCSIGGGQAVLRAQDAQCPRRGGVGRVEALQFLKQPFAFYLRLLGLEHGLRGRNDGLAVLP